MREEDGRREPCVIVEPPSDELDGRRVDEDPEYPYEDGGAARDEDECEVRRDNPLVAPTSDACVEESTDPL